MHVSIHVHVLMTDTICNDLSDSHSCCINWYIHFTSILLQEESFHISLDRKVGFVLSIDTITPGPARDVDATILPCPI
jgi:hypothetical protein